MISWIKGEHLCSWKKNQRNYILINCQGIGYEIQITKYKEFSNEKASITLWIQHIKREDYDSLFGFIKKEERDFFRELLNVKGIGPQIGMSLLNKYSIEEVIYSIQDSNKQLISSVPGIGPKMTERILLELKNKLKIDIESSRKETTNETPLSSEIRSMLEDIEITLNSLSYHKKDIKNVLQILLNDIDKKVINNNKKNNEFGFEYLLKKAMKLLEKDKLNGAL